MKKINKFQLRKELRKNFAFYDMYKLYLELTYLEMSCDELEIMFEIIHKGQLLHTEEKTYSEVERYYFIRENFNKINLSLLDCISNDNVLIMPTNPKYKSKTENELKSELLAENLRLLYVAITRAKRKLFITASKKSTAFGKTVEQTPSLIFSEFLGGINE